MKRIVFKVFITLALTSIGLIWNGNICSTVEGMITKADARAGRPATPVSYAGVARRSTVGAGAPGVGVSRGVGAGALGVGAAPRNQGGPVNRVGRR